MWKLYDDLYIGIPSGILITGCVIGEKWTTVRAGDNIGIARTMELPKDPASFASQYVGKPLRDTGCHMKWDTLAGASVGVAALNAWYNTSERADGLEGSREPAALSGSVAYVGDYTGGDVFPLPLEADFETAKYAKLAEYDNVVIASEALITRSLPKLFDIIGESGKVVLEGYSLPATALFFAFDMPVREIRGYYTRFVETIEACAVKNIADPTPGMLPFCIKPMKVEKVHESESAREALDSPYNSIKFNNNFN